jgi:hypothetical protein
MTKATAALTNFMVHPFCWSVPQQLEVAVDRLKLLEDLLVNGAIELLCHRRPDRIRRE